MDLANLNNVGGWHVGLNSNIALGFSILIIVLIIWTFIWKGMALWKAARLGSKGWFVVMLLINTLGILEILYLYVFSKPSKKADGGQA